MDNVDLKILEMLHRNSRLSMRKIAETLPMSVPATCERVKKLEDAGVIENYTIDIDPFKMGNSVNAFMLFAPNHGYYEDMIEWAKNDYRIVSCWTLAGKFSLMFEISCKDMVEYGELVSTLFQKGTSESYIMVESHKFNKRFDKSNL